MATEASINDWVLALSSDELRRELVGRGLDTAGNKADLQRRLADEVYGERGIDQQASSPPAVMSAAVGQDDPPPPYVPPASSTTPIASTPSVHTMGRSVPEAPRTSSPIDNNCGFGLDAVGRPRTGTVPRTLDGQRGGLTTATASSCAQSGPAEQAESGYLSQTSTGFLQQSTVPPFAQSDRQSLGTAHRIPPQSNNATGLPNRSFFASTAISNTRNAQYSNQPGGHTSQQNAGDNRHLITDVSNLNPPRQTIRLHNGYNSTIPRRALAQVDNILPMNSQENYFNNPNNEAQNYHQQAQGSTITYNTQRQAMPPPINREQNTRSVRFNEPQNHPDRRVITPTPIGAFEFMRKCNLKFSGRRDEDSEEFLRKIKQGRFIMYVSDDDLFGVLPFFLHGVALQWYRCNSGNWVTFEQFEDAWRARFSDADFQYALMENARRRTQGEREPVVDYLTYIKAMFDRMIPPLGATREIDLALRNMLPRLQIRIDKSEIFTFQELEGVAVRKEKSLLIARSFRPPPG